MNFISCQLNHRKHKSIILLLGLVTLFMIEGPTVSAKEIWPIKLELPQGARILLKKYRDIRIPVTVGVPFAEGTLHNDDVLYLYASENKNFMCPTIPKGFLPLQIQTTAYWDDQATNIRWVLLDFQTFHGHTTYYLCKYKRQRKIFKPISSFNFKEINWISYIKQKKFPINLIPFMTPLKYCRPELKLKGKVNSSVVETDGMLRKVTRLEGYFRRPSSTEPATGNRFLARITRYKGIPVAKVEVTILFGDFFSNQSTSTSEPWWGPWKEIGIKTNIRPDPRWKNQYQLDWMNKKGKPGKSIGWISGTLGKNFIGLAVPFFREKFPRALRRGKDGKLIIDIWPDFFRAPQTYRFLADRLKNNKGEWIPENVYKYIVREYPFLEGVNSWKGSLKLPNPQPYTLEKCKNLYFLPNDVAKEVSFTSLLALLQKKLNELMNFSKEEFEKNLSNYVHYLNDLKNELYFLGKQTVADSLDALIDKIKAASNVDKARKDINKFIEDNNSILKKENMEFFHIAHISYSLDYPSYVQPGPDAAWGTATTLTYYMFFKEKKASRRQRKRLKALVKYLAKGPSIAYLSPEYIRNTGVIGMLSIEGKVGYRKIDSLMWKIFVGETSRLDPCLYTDVFNINGHSIGSTCRPRWLENERSDQNSSILQYNENDPEDRLNYYGMWNFGGGHSDWNITHKYGGWSVYRMWASTHHNRVLLPWLYFLRVDPYSDYLLPLPEVNYNTTPLQRLDLYFRYAWRTARHIIDVHYVHLQGTKLGKLGVPKKLGAVTRYKSWTHWGRWNKGGSEIFDYNQMIEPILLDYYLTGDERARDILLEVMFGGEYWEQRFPGYTERLYSASMDTAIDLYRFALGMHSHWLDKILPEYLRSQVKDMKINNHNGGKPTNNQENLLDLLKAHPTIAGFDILRHFVAIIYGGRNKYNTAVIEKNNPGFLGFTRISKLLGEQPYFNRDAFLLWSVRLPYLLDQWGARMVKTAYTYKDSLVLPKIKPKDQSSLIPLDLPTLLNKINKLVMDFHTLALALASDDPRPFIRPQEITSFPVFTMYLSILDLEMQTLSKALIKNLEMSLFIKKMIDVSTIDEETYPIGSIYFLERKVFWESFLFLLNVEKWLINYGRREISKTMQQYIWVWYHTHYLLNKKLKKDNCWRIKDIERATFFASRGVSPSKLGEVALLYALTNFEGQKGRLMLDQDIDTGLHKVISRDNVKSKLYVENRNPDPNKNPVNLTLITSINFYPDSINADSVKPTIKTFNNDELESTPSIKQIYPTIKILGAEACKPKQGDIVVNSEDFYHVYDKQSDKSHLYLVPSDKPSDTIQEVKDNGIPVNSSDMAVLAWPLRIFKVRLKGCRRYLIIVSDDNINELEITVYNNNPNVYVLSKWYNDKADTNQKGSNPLLSLRSPGNFCFITKSIQDKQIPINIYPRMENPNGPNHPSYFFEWNKGDFVLTDSLDYSGPLTPSSLGGECPRLRDSRSLLVPILNLNKPKILCVHTPALQFSNLNMNSKYFGCRFPEEEKVQDKIYRNIIINIPLTYSKLTLHGFYDISNIHYISQHPQKFARFMTEKWLDGSSYMDILTGKAQKDPYNRLDNPLACPYFHLIFDKDHFVNSSQLCAEPIMPGFYQTVEQMKKVCKLPKYMVHLHCN